MLAQRLPLRAAARAAGGARGGAPAAWFSDTGLLPAIAESVQRELGVWDATDVQRQAIPEVLKGEDIIFGSHTGSGKTLAYLLPAIQRQKLMEEELVVGMPKPYRPRILVIVPSRELCEQVADIAKDLSHVIKFSAMALTGGTKRSVQRRKLRDGVDLLVATPGRLKMLRDDHRLHLSEVHTVILDEVRAPIRARPSCRDPTLSSLSCAQVDTMVDAGFGAEIRAIMDSLNRRRERDGAAVQFVGVGATLTPRVQKRLQRLFPRARMLMSGSMLRASPTVAQRFVDHSGPNRYATLTQVLRDDPPTQEAQTLVFCNSADSARATQHTLREHGFVAASLHGEIPPAMRAQNYDAFVCRRANILVCTDIAARGLDLRAVDHVINFDFPRSSVDYVHRIGRTARCGSHGRVTSIVAKPDRPLARAIQVRRAPLGCAPYPPPQLTAFPTLSSSSCVHSGRPRPRSPSPRSRWTGRAALSRRRRRPSWRWTPARSWPRCRARPGTGGAPTQRTGAVPPRTLATATRSRGGSEGGGASTSVAPAPGARLLEAPVPGVLPLGAPALGGAAPGAAARPCSAAWAPRRRLAATRSSG